MKLFEVFGEIKLKDDDVKKKLNETDNAAAKMGKTFKKNAAIIGGVALAAGALGAKFISLANDQERAETRLTSIAKNVTGATDEQVQSMMRLAAAQQKVTTYGDEVIMAGQSQILSFGVQTESAEKLTQSMTDLLAANNGANATQEDAINAANMLGKALNGQAGALSRAGILVSDTQKEMLELGDETERVSALTQIMEDNYGGLSQELAGTTEGQFIQLKNQLGDIGEQIGEVLIPFALELIKTISRMAEAWAETFGWLNGILGETSGMIRDVQQEQMSALRETLSEQKSAMREKMSLINQEKNAFIQAERDKIMAQVESINESIELERQRTDELIQNAASGASARIKALRNEQDEYNDFVEDQIEKEEEVLEKFIERLEEEQEAFEETKEAEIKLLNEQYNAQIKLLDAEANEKIKKLNKEIENIQKQAKKEKEIEDKRKEEQKRSDLEVAVAQADTREEKERAEERLNEFLLKLERERIEKEREQRIDTLKDKIDNIEKETKEKKKNVELQFQTEKEKLENEILEKKSAVNQAIEERKRETRNVITQLTEEKEAYNAMVDDKMEKISEGSAYYQKKLKEDFEKFEENKEKQIEGLEELHEKIKEQPDLIDTSKFDKQLEDVSKFYGDVIKETEKSIKDLDEIMKDEEEKRKKAAVEAVKKIDVVSPGKGMMGGIGSAIDGMRANGGPVEEGGSYLVGERGPEVITMGGNGNVTPNENLGFGGVTVQNMTVRKQSDIKEIARELFLLQKQTARGFGN